MIAFATKLFCILPFYAIDRITVSLIPLCRLSFFIKFTRCFFLTFTLLDVIIVKTLSFSRQIPLVYNFTAFCSPATNNMIFFDAVHR